MPRILFPRKSFGVVTAVCLTGAISGAFADGLMLLPSLGYYHLDGHPHGAESHDEQSEHTDHSSGDDDHHALLDIFYNYNGDAFRFLAEYVYANHEKELERFQLGWRVNESHTVWLGKVHNPNSYWNTQYHHGNYMRTTLSTPGIVAYEDEGGLLPAHISGLMLEGKWALDDYGQALKYSFVAGVGGSLDESLEAIDLANPDQEGHGLYSFSLSYYPDDALQDTLGFNVSKGKIATPGDIARSLDQTTLGLFVDYQFDRWRTLSEVHWVETDGLDDHNDSFVNIYSQLEWMANNNLTLYGRIEKSFSNDLQEGRYQTLFPDYQNKMLSRGPRLDFSARHAIKLDWGEHKHQTGEKYSVLAAEWSMIF